MSAFTFFKKIFGFTPDDEVLSDDTDISYEDSEPVESAPVQPASPTMVTPPSFDPKMKERLFAGVVAVFNEALPDFLRRSVNPEAQQQRLAEVMDASCNQYLDSLLRQAQEYAEARLKSAADEARQESARLKEEMENVNRARNQLREQQLSADRRSRALSERVRDLEEQVQKLDAEREQFQLENKSLLNKLKVADVQPGVVDNLTREVEELRTRLAEGGNVPAASYAEHSEELNAVKAELQSVQAALSSAHEENTSLKEENANLEAEVSTANDNFENATKRAEMQEAMYSDLQKTLADTKAEVEMAQANAEQMEEKANAKLEEARGVIKNFSKLEKQFEDVAKMIKKRDETIERLKSEKKELADALKARNSGMSGNLFAYSNEGEGVVESAPEYGAAQPLPDDDFQVPDWFVSEPAPIPKENDPEFGYQEPPKKPRHTDSDAQMSLFE